VEADTVTHQSCSGAIARVRMSEYNVTVVGLTKKYRYDLLESGLTPA
jgi:hypothetical protein